MSPDIRRSRTLDRLLLSVLVAGIVINFIAVRAAAGRTFERPLSCPAPMQVAGWKGSLLPDDPNVQSILKNARVTTVQYARSGSPPISLLITASRDPNDLHTPDRCLIGSGFQIVSDQPARIDVAGPSPISWSCRRLATTYGTDKEIVYYGFDGLSMQINSTLLARIAAKLGGTLKSPVYFIRVSTSEGGAGKQSDEDLRRFLSTLLASRNQWEEQGRNAHR